MQTVTESATKSHRMPETENVITAIRYIDKSGTLTEMLVNLGTHEGRVKLSKTAIWAMRRNIELRIIRL